MADAKMFDFDAPEALDMALLMDCIARLRVGGWAAECPEGVGPAGEGRRRWTWHS